eukprot:jgi/Pico_ML_1/52761/g3424.t1
MNAGECPKMGSTVVRGEVEATVEATGADTFFGKTAMLINNASGGLSNVQKVLLNIMVVLMFLCIALCGTAFFYLIFKMKENVPDALSFAVVVLVASIPMAMELVTTSTMAIGSHTLAGMDAIVTCGLQALRPTSKRTEAEIEKKDGSERFKVTKGAPNIIIELCEEKESIRDIVQTEVMAFAERGVRCLAVAKTEENGQYRFQGILTFLDPPRPDTKYTLDKAKDFGIAVKMITGDHTVIGKETMRQLGQGTNLLSADALPELDSSAADIVLTKPGLSVLVEAIIIARSIFQRIKNYIIYRVACTIQLLLFFFVGLLLFHPNTYCPPGDNA